MKGKMKCLTAGILSVILMCCGGCGAKFNASDYVSSCLEMQCKGESSEYEKLTGTSKEEVYKEYEDILDQEMGSFEKMGLSDSLVTKMRKAFKDMYKLGKYQVGEAKDNGNGSYTVPVTCYQLKVFDGVRDKTNEEWKAYIEGNQTEYASLTSEEEAERQMELLYNNLMENIKKPVYAKEPKVVSVIVKQAENGDKEYEIPSVDSSALNSALFDYSNY